MDIMPFSVRISSSGDGGGSFPLKIPWQLPPKGKRREKEGKERGKKKERERSGGSMYNINFASRLTQAVITIVT